MKFFAGLFFGGVAAWAVTADYYGHIAVHSPIAGIACRVNGLETVRMGDFLDGYSWVCADLSSARPEQEVHDEMMERFRTKFEQKDEG